MIEITYTYSLKDYRALQLLIIRSRLGSFFYLAILLLVIVALNSIAIFYTEKNIMILIPGIFMIAGVLFAYFFLSKREFETNPLLTVEQKVYIDQDDIVTSNAHGNLKMGWKNIHKTLRTKDFFAIYITPNNVLAIPMRALTPDSLEKLETYAANAGGQC